MEERACIYCGNTEISESDIVPDALTNARITNKNVCKTEHNNKFSDLFESDVIAALALITNELDIKSRKGNSYAAYQAKIKIDGIEYSTKMTSEKELFNGKKVLISTDKKYKLSSMEKIKEMAEDQSQVEAVDINKFPLQTSVEISIEIYFSKKMFRMISKIAYEWYCSRNNVSGYHEEFSNIVSYITSGRGNNPVTILQNEELYNYYEEQVSLGSHGLFCFIGKGGKINVIVSLFGIAMYRVIVSNIVPSFCKNNFLFMELRTDSSRKEIIHSSYEDAEKCLLSTFSDKNSFIEREFIPGLRIRIQKEVPKIDIILYSFVLDITKAFFELYDETLDPNETINKIIYHNIEEILQTSSLHKKAIKRFVKEYFFDGHEVIKLNPDSSNKKTLFLMYILFIIGRNNIEIIDDNLLQRIAKEALGMGMENKFVVTDEMEKKLQGEILSTEGYSEFLEKGAEVIKRWKD